MNDNEYREVFKAGYYAAYLDFTMPCMRPVIEDHVSIEKLIDRHLISEVEQFKLIGQLIVEAVKNGKV